MTAPVIRAAGLRKSFGAVEAVREVSLEIRTGEFFALLGPSGCGKTTVLRLLAGLEHPDAGAVFIDGRDMTFEPANRRPVNTVFQSYALFPHLSALDNVAYGLRAAGVGRAAARLRAEEALDLVALGGYGRRLPDRLSGGERQRVALARALVKQPRALLLDEPLAALDTPLREQMRFELVRLRETVGIAFVLVTHDREEALSMADRVAVMEGGTIRQTAPPMELYEHPADCFTAGFIGAVNLIAGTGRRTASGGFRIEAPGLGARLAVGGAPGVADGRAVWLAVRPEKIAIARPGDEEPLAAACNRLAGQVEDVSYRGGLSIYGVRIAPGSEGVLRVSRPNTGGAPARAFAVGDRAVLTWPAEAGAVLTS